jgi:WS/DGAT/MGAT family acyltransferase
MQQLTGIDASFLYLETPRSPMHIGGVYIFAPPAGSEMTFATFKRYIDSRLHLFKTFRQKVMFSPMGLGHPYWVDDEDFNLTNHLYHIALPKPAGKKELMEASAQVYARLLDRSKPLWEITFVEGLSGMEGIPENAWAMITKVHHAAIDGVSGAEMMAAILNLTPQPEEIPAPYPWQPEKVPNSWQLLSNNAWQMLGVPIDAGKFAIDTIKNSVGTLVEALTNVVQTPPMPFTAPSSAMNVTITSSRSFAGIELPLGNIKKIKNAVGGVTVNDVVLAICAGALRSYWKRRGELPYKSLVSMCPISVRTDEQRQDLGNQVSAMLVSLATQEEDAFRRLLLIAESSQGSKVYSKAIRANELMNFVPSTLASLGSRLYVSMRLAEMHSPFYNLVITNVPGPPSSLYLQGSKLITHFGTAPVLDGLGLLIVVFSYNDKLSIAITSTREIIPSAHELEQDFEKSFAELYEETVIKAVKR